MPIIDYREVTVAREMDMEDIVDPINPKPYTVQPCKLAWTNFKELALQSKAVGTCAKLV